MPNVKKFITTGYCRINSPKNFKNVNVLLPPDEIAKSTLKEKPKPLQRSGLGFKTKGTQF